MCPIIFARRQIVGHLRQINQEIRVIIRVQAFKFTLEASSTKPKEGDGERCDNWLSFDPAQ